MATTLGNVSDIFGLGEGYAPGFGTSATFRLNWPRQARRWSLPPAAVVWDGLASIGASAAIGPPISLD